MPPGSWIKELLEAFVISGSIWLPGIQAMVTKVSDGLLRMLIPYSVPSYRRILLWILMMPSLLLR